MTSGWLWVGQVKWNAKLRFAIFHAETRCAAEHPAARLHSQGQQSPVGIRLMGIGWKQVPGDHQYVAIVIRDGRRLVTRASLVLGDQMSESDLPHVHGRVLSCL